MLPQSGPFAQSLGVVAENDGAFVTCTMKYSPSLIGSTTLHGGTVATLLKEAAALEVVRQHPGRRQPALISVTTKFMRAGKPQDTFANASITRSGARVVHVEATAWQEDRDRPIATAQASFLLD
jgi:acyl-coenzyme A thioesterase PaaI-like protein